MDSKNASNPHCIDINIKTTYHGVPRCICDCTAMNQEKIPRHVAEHDNTTIIQMLSWSSGQW